MLKTLCIAALVAGTCSAPRPPDSVELAPGCVAALRGIAVYDGHPAGCYLSTNCLPPTASDWHRWQVFYHEEGIYWSRHAGGEMVPVYFCPGGTTVYEGARVVHHSDRVEWPAAH